MKSTEIQYQIHPKKQSKEDTTAINFKRKNFQPENCLYRYIYVFLTYYMNEKYQDLLNFTYL